MIRPVKYLQTDPRWKSNSYAVDGESSTIGSAGCGPTAMAMVLASLVSTYIDPLTCASWARMKNYKVYKSGTSYSFPCAIGKEYGVDVKRLNTSNVYGAKNSSVHQMALQELQKGNWLIACMGKGNWTSSGHYIVVYGYSNGYVYINDSASTKETREKNTWELFKSQVKFYWSVTVPEDIKKNGLTKSDKYSFEEFVREIQMTLKASIDGRAGNQTLSKTVTVSSSTNKKHNVVYPLQKCLKSIGLYTGALDKSAGPLFTAAVKLYQSKIVAQRTPDGVITAKQKTWKSLLGLL